MPDESGDRLQIYRNRSASGGVNTLSHPYDINDDQAVDLTNIDTSSPGVRASRKGMSLIASGATFGPPLALQEYTPSSFNAELLMVAPGTTYPTAAHLKLWKWDGTTTVWSLVGTLTGFTSATMPIDVVPGLDLNAVGGPAVVRISTRQAQDIAYVYNGSALASCQQQPTTGMSPIVYGLNRAFGAGRAGLSRSKIFYSDVASFCATGWKSTQALTMGGGSRQEVVAVKFFRQNDLIVFMADRVEALQVVDNPFTISSGDVATQTWSRQVVDTTIGCGARRSVVTVGQDLFFCDQYGNIRSLARTIQDNAQGTTTRPISAAIQTWIDRINPNSFDTIVATAYDRYYVVGFPIDSATRPSHTFVFDRVNESWMGPWTGGWQPECMAVATLNAASASADRNPTLYLGAQSTGNALVYRTFSGTTDAGSAIVYQETGKRITADQLEADKLYRRIKTYFSASGAATMQIEARRNGETYRTVGYVDLTGDLPALPQTLPFDLGGGGVIEDTQTLEDFEVSKDLQLRFTCTATTEVKMLGYSVAIHRKNFDWTLSP